jgi:hypothetical protein
MDEAAHPNEQELRALMISGLDGDGAAHRALLERLSGHLRDYFKQRFARIGHGRLKSGRRKNEGSDEDVHPRS